MKEIPKDFHIAGVKHHFLQLVIDGEDEIVVAKFWRPVKQVWDYAAVKKEAVLFSIALSDDGE